MLEEAGVHLMAGESIEYVIVDQAGKKNPDKAKPLALYAYEDGYDVEKYTELLLDAAATVFEPLGHSKTMLQEECGGKQRKRTAVGRQTQITFEFEPVQKEEADVGDGLATASLANAGAERVCQTRKRHNLRQRLASQLA